MAVHRSAIRSVEGLEKAVTTRKVCVGDSASISTVQVVKLFRKKNLLSVLFATPVATIQCGF